MDTSNKSTEGNSKTDKAPVIEIKNLRKSFGNNHVLRGFDFTLYKGENVAILGQSGCGKSVLIKCIVGLLKPDSGMLLVFGKNVMKMNQDELNDIRSRIGFLFQSSALYDSMTVRENLEFPIHRLGIKKDPVETEELIKKALKDIGLSHAIDLMPSELSGGMRKRIGLARTLILNPEIILYDEPTTGLDPITSKEISNLMIKISKTYNTSSMIISHDLGCIKLTSDRIVLLMDGINYAEGTYQELEKSNDERVTRFFN